MPLIFHQASYFKKTRICQGQNNFFLQNHHFLLSDNFLYINLDAMEKEENRREGHCLMHYRWLGCHSEGPGLLTKNSHKMPWVGSSLISPLQ